MMTLLFATPWYLLLTLVIVGGVIARTGNQRQQTGTRNLGLGLIGLAVVLLTLSFFFETDMEKVKRLNRELVQSVPAGDWTKMAELLDADATMGTVEATFFGNRKDLVAGARATSERWGLKSVTIIRTDESQDGSHDITVDIDVLSKQDKTDAVIAGTPSSWQMVWGQTNKEWHCRQIKCLKIGGESGSHVEKFIR